MPTKRVPDDDAARCRSYSGNPKLATWYSSGGDSQALVKVQRSYTRVTKAQVYLGDSRWSAVEEISSPNVVLDGGAGWGSHPPAWETPAAD